MVRTLFLTPCIQSALPHWEDQEPVTANRVSTGVLRALERTRVSQTLEDLAHRVLADQDVQIASVVSSHRAFRAAAAAVGGLDPRDATQALLPTVRAVFRAGIDLQVLATMDSARARRIARLGMAYREYLSAGDAVDAADALWTAAGRAVQRSPLFVYGYARLAPDELAFIDARAGDGSLVALTYADHPIFFENAGAADFLRARGWQIVHGNDAPSAMGERVAGRMMGIALPGGPVAAHLYHDLEAEVRGTLVQVKQLLAAGASPAEIALVASDEALYGPTVMAVAWEYGVPVRPRYTIALPETRVGAWLRLLCDALAQDLAFEPTARLLGHVLGGGVAPGAWRAARRSHPKGLEAWRAIGVDLETLAWPGHDTRGAYVQRLRGLIDEYKLRTRAGRSTRDFYALKRAKEEGLALVAEPVQEALTKQEFLREAAESFALLRVPVLPGIGGVELLSPILALGARYRHLFVMGMAEGTLPRLVQNDPALDFHERQALSLHSIRLEQATDLARREQLIFYNMLQAATDSLTLSYPRLLGQREALPSPYFSLLGLQPVQSSGELPAASPEEARAAYLRLGGLADDYILGRARQAWAVEQRREGPAEPDEYDGIVGVPVDATELVFSASQLTVISQCPFHWFARWLLRLAEPDEADTDLGVALRGNLYHKALELAATWSMDAPDQRQAMLDSLERAFLQAEQDLNLPPFPAWAARRQEHLAVLRRAIQGADYLQDGARIVGLERKFEGEWHGLKVTGYVDRIDRAVDGLILVDYKTRSSKPRGAKDEEGRLTLDVQLPLYLHAAPALYPGERARDAYYYSLTAAKKLGVDADDAQLARLAAEAQDRLHAGRFPVEPDGMMQVCEHCAYDPVCRRGPRLRRKRRVNRDADA